MMTIARVETETPARYMGQLCKHFAHRIPASHDDRQGRIEFTEALCELEAQEGVLFMRLTAADGAVMARMQKVVTDHLLRFAFRDPPQVAWQAA